MIIYKLGDVILLFCMYGLPFAAAFIASGIYLSAYKKMINERLAHYSEYGAKKKPLVEPIKFFIAVFAAAFVISQVLGRSLTSAYNYTDEHRNKYVSDLSFGYCWVNKMSSPSLLDGYKVGDDIPGYRRMYEVTKNDVRMCCYYSDDKKIGEIPSSLVGVTYLGDKADNYLLSFFHNSANGLIFNSEDEWRYFSECSAKNDNWFTVDLLNYDERLEIVTLLDRKSMSNEMQECNVSYGINADGTEYVSVCGLYIDIKNSLSEYEWKLKSES